MLIPTGDLRRVSSVSSRHDRPLLWVPSDQSSVSRRGFLSSAGRVVATGITLPVIGNWQTNPFTAEAQSWWGWFFRILGGAADLVTILTFLGLRPVYGREVDYQNAGGCTKPLQAHEASMRAGGLEMFTPVARSPHDQNVAVLAGQTAPGTKVVKAARVDLSMQYEGKDPVAITQREIALVAAASEFLVRQYQLKGAGLARSITVVRKQDGHVDDPYYRNKLVPVIFYHNQGDGWFRYDKRPFGQATAGAIAIHQPPFTDPDHPPLIGLVA